MRRFLIKLALFVAPILLALALVEYELARVPTGYAAKRRYLDRTIGEARVLVTGSSHAHYAVHPRLFGVPAFNTAYVSQDVYYDTRIVLKYLPRAAHLKLVIVSVSYFSFEGRIDDSAAAWRSPFYRRHWGIGPASPGFRWGDYSYIALYGAQRTRSLLWDRFRNSGAEHIDPEDGHAVLLRPSRAEVMSGKAAVGRHHTIMKVENIERNVRHLGELFDALRARGVAAVIITTPVSRSYAEHMRPDTYRRMQDAVGDLCRRYGLEYRNYLTDARFAPDDFADSNHLNARGAEQFSLILKDEVVSKYVR
ncbi:MAG: SGNH/GDSL hydrolase family protein [Acidobacteriota bacterium]|nr:SGNH/GDSL hydrolase family protein [Acidobacteriota bacterium]